MGSVFGLWKFYGDGVQRAADQGAEAASPQKKIGGEHVSINGGTVPQNGWIRMENHGTSH